MPERAAYVANVERPTREVATEAEALLVDEGWHAPEPEPVIVEAEPVAVAAAVDDSHEEACEPQRTLFFYEGRE